MKTTYRGIQIAKHGTRCRIACDNNLSHDRMANAATLSAWNIGTVKWRMTKINMRLATKVELPFHPKDA